MEVTDLIELKTSGLLSLYANVIEELRRRNVVRSNNNPVADYAENLAVKALNLTKVPPSTKGYDAVDKDNHRYEIKSRRITKHNKSRQLSAIRELENPHFDFLVGILFNSHFLVLHASVIPYAEIKRIATYRVHTNSWVVHLKDDLLERPGVRDVTLPFRHAAESF